MHSFSNFIDESRKNYNSISLLSSEINTYLNKVNKIVPKPVQNAIYITKKYNITSASDLDEIKNSNKGQLGALAARYSMPLEEMEAFWKVLKDLKASIRLMPQYLSARQREALEKGVLSTDDLTIDLDTPQGRNAATKIYAPVMYKIVNQYVGKSSFNRAELISSALEGFTNAMNDWRRDEGDGKHISFKTYAAYRMQQQILNDINKHSHGLSGGSNYVFKKYGGALLDTVSYDSMTSQDDDSPLDHLTALAEEPEVDNMSRDEEKKWEVLYKIIENKFKQRDCDIFYRYFGINGYKREKSVDIAREYGMSLGNIRNSIINKMLAFLKNDRRAMSVLRDIQEIYNESLICELINNDKDYVIETLLNDDIFILLEDLTRWDNKAVFINALRGAFEGVQSSGDKKILIDILSHDFNYLDDLYKKHKKLIILFLRGLYPTENINRKTDVSVLEYMNELQNYYKRHNINPSQLQLS